MSRSAKESDDEFDAKTNGRRTRAAIAGPIVQDSPLRRSTRHRPTVEHSSPEATNIVDPPTRSTRRRTATVETSNTENARTLRSRKNSATSDTTDFTDSETTSESKKRVTRKSITAVTAVVTPTKPRLRRSTRAGSESKTMSPSVRTTRRTRASSVDLEDNRETKDNFLIQTNNTPIKTRTKASALPSEPAVEEEETEIFHDTLTEHFEESTTDNSASSKLSLSKDSTKSSVKLDVSAHDGDEKNSMEVNDDIFESPSQLLPEQLESPKKMDSDLKKQLIIDMQEKSTLDVPYVVLNKADLSLKTSPGNKENEKSNIILTDTKKFQLANTMPTQRKSAAFVCSEKIDIQTKLNRSVDDKLLTTSEQQLKKLPESTSEPIVLNKSQDSGLVSITFSSKNDSIICLDDTETSVISSKDKDTDESMKLTEENTEKIDTSTHEEVGEKPAIDTTAENKIISAPLDEQDIAKESSTSIDESRAMISDESMVLEFPAESTVEECMDKDENNEKKRLSLKKRDSIMSQNTDETAKIDDNDENIENLFHDIPAEEWKTSDPRLSAADESNDGKNLESQDDKVIELIPVNKEAWETREKERDITAQQASDCESDDTVIVQNRNLPLKSPEIIQTVITPEEPMDVDEDEEVTDAPIVENNPNQSRRSSIAMELNNRRSMSGTSLPFNNESDDKNAEISEVSTENLNLSSRKSIEKIIADESEVSIEFEQTTVIRKSLDSKKSPANKRRSSNKIEKLNSSNLNASTCEEDKETENITTNRKSIEKIVADESEQSVESEQTTVNRKSLDSKKSPANKRRSSNKMENINLSTDQNVVEVNIDEDEKELSMNSSKKRESLDKSCEKKKKTPSKIQLSFDDDTDEDEGESPKKLQKRKSNRKSLNASRNTSSSVIQINSDSESDENSSASDDENGETKILPALKEKGYTNSDVSDDDDDGAASIDSDIAKEYNMNGDSNIAYSDDDVPADECRASETETSDDGDDDDDEDMADFINDEEELSGEEESDESDVENDEEVDEEMNEESDKEMENSQKELVNEESENEQSEEEASINIVSTSVKKLQFDTSNDSPDNDEEIVLNKSKSRLSDKHKVTPNKSNVSIQIQEPTPKLSKKSRQSLSEHDESIDTSVSSHTQEPTPKLSKKSRQSLREHDKSIDTSVSLHTQEPTPKLSKKSRQSLSELDKSIVPSPKKTIDATADKAESGKKAKLRKKSLTAWNTSEMLDSSTQIVDSPVTAEEKDVKLHKKSSSLSKLNKTMLTPNINSPDLKSLMKEKLNDSLPAIKLNRRSLKVSRRSTLEDVDECQNNINEEQPEEVAIKYTDNITDSTNKKKKKKKSIGVFEEETCIVEPKLITNDDTQSQKKKKKKKKIAEVNEEMSESVELSPDDNIVNKKKRKSIERHEPNQSVELISVVEEGIVTEKLKKKKKANDGEVPTIEDQSHEESSRKKKKKQRRSDISEQSTSENITENIDFRPTELKKKKLVASSIKVIKRQHDDEDHPDVSTRPNKRRKLNKKIVPSTTMYASEHDIPRNLTIEDTGYIALSSSGGTTQFSVVNLKKLPAKRTRTTDTAASTFRERMLSRNPRQTVSAYLMYQQKRKASGKNVF